MEISCSFSDPGFRRFATALAAAGAAILAFGAAVATEMAATRPKSCTSSRS